MLWWLDSLTFLPDDAPTEFIWAPGEKTITLVDKDRDQDRAIENPSALRILREYGHISPWSNG